MLIGLTKGNDTLRFSYDAGGLVQAVNYNGTYYYYLRNGQGDVVKLIDGSGATVVEYTYDSWGKQLSCTGTLATTLGVLNPFRYRGYVYDEETGFYYLKSRHYDPETCRFISADVLLSTGQGVLGHNCYAYCGSNSVNRIDPGGTSWAILVLVILLGGIATAAGCKKRGPDGEHEPDAKPEPEDSFIYNPSDIDSQEFKQFQKDFGMIAIANKADYNAGLDKSIWGDQGQRPMAPAIRIHFGGQIAQNMFIEYAEKYGYEKLASNLAQLVVTKYNIGLERDYPRGYDAATIAKDIYGRLIGWSKGEQVFSDDYYIVY